MKITMLIPSYPKLDDFLFILSSSYKLTPVLEMGIIDEKKDFDE